MAPSRSGDGSGISNVRAKVEFDSYFIRSLGAPTTLVSQAAIGDETISVASTSGFEVDEYIGIFCPSENRYFFSDIVGINGTIIDLDTPLDFAYQPGDNVQPLSRNINIDASENVIFDVRAGAIGSALAVNIAGFRLVFNTTSFDPGQFGNLSALERGICFRRIDGITKNLFTVKNNFDLSAICNINFIEDNGNRKVVIAEYLFEHRMTALQLLPGDKIEMIIRDNLTGLDFMRALAFGYEVKK